MRIWRRVLTSALLLGAVAACAGGPSSRLKTVAAATGEGPIDFRVKNTTDVPINSLYIAPTAVIDTAGREHIAYGSTEADRVWGPDLITGGALEVGGEQRVPVDAPGRFDIKVHDKDGRHQHVSGLKLGAGGRYILELGDGGWRVGP